MLKNITLEEALGILIKESQCTKPVYVPLMEGLGSIIAEDVISDLLLPPFDKSPLDGYALRAADLLGAKEESPVTLKVVGYVAAGHLYHHELKEGEAVRIMTGAKIPLGADVVVPFEETAFTEAEVSLFKEYKPQSNIIKAGEDIQLGQKILTKGDYIDAPEIGVLASLGRSHLLVYRRPKVAILSTGDELVDLQQPLGEGKIRNSNSYTIGAQVKKVGAEAILLGIASDGIDMIKDRVKMALEWADVVITTGGVSVGDCDLVKEAFEAIGAELLFWRVKMKPGTPIAVAKYGDQLLFGLSGNPAAAYITFEQLVRPTLLKMMGRVNFKFLEVQAVLENDFNKISPQNRFVRASTYYQEGKYYTKLPSNHSSGVLSSLVGTNSLFYIPMKEGPFKKGQEITVQLLNQLEGN